MSDIGSTTPKDNKYDQKGTNMFVESGQWFRAMPMNDHERLVIGWYCSADKVHAIWSGIAGKLDYLSIWAYLLLMPSSISRFGQPAHTWRSDVTGEWDTNYQNVICSTCQIFTTKCCHGCLCSYCCIFRVLILRQVMKVLLRHHGVNLSEVTSDLYTGVGRC